MRARDFVLLAVLVIVVAGLLAPSWLNPSVFLLSFGDLYTYHYPLRHLAFSTIAAGRLPFWNPYIFGGLPLLANGQSVLFYPVSLLGLIFPLTLSFSWDYLVHFVWAGLGVALLARQAKLSAASAAVLAALYALCPFLVYRATEGVPTLLASLSWAPWCWLAWLSGSAWLLSAVWALQFLSGHPQFMLVNGFGMLAWLLYRRKGVRALFSGLFLGGAAFLALALCQWVPSLEFLRHSVREIWPANFMLAYSVHWKDLAGWVRPWALGDPLRPGFNGVPSVFFETSPPYLGLAGLALALWGFWSSRAKDGLALAALGLFLAGVGASPLSSLLTKTPLQFLRVPSRFLLVGLWGLLLSVGAALRTVPGRWRLIVFMIVLVELGLWDRHFLGVEKAGPYVSVNAALAGAIGGGSFRVLTHPALGNPDKTMLYRAMNVNGYDAIYLKDFPAFAAKSEGSPAADPSRSYLSRPDSMQMKEMGVSVRIDSKGHKPVHGAFSLARFDGPALKPQRSALSLSILSPEHWLVYGFLPSGARRIVLAEPFYPGWRARVDGEPARIERWDGFLQSLPVSASRRPGEKVKVELSFEPTAWPLLVFGAAASWLVWFSLGLAALP